MSKKLNENQQLAIQLLASGKTCTAIAETLKVCKETISRWKQLPEFQAALNTLIEEIRESARNRLAAMVEKALEVIEADLQSTDNPVQRVKTAFKVLELVGAGGLALPEKPLPTDAEAIREQRKSDDMWQKLEIF